MSSEPRETDVDEIIYERNTDFKESLQNLKLLTKMAKNATEKRKNAFYKKCPRSLVLYVLLMKGRSAGQRHTHTNRQRDRQTDRQTSQWVFTARLHPQFRMPPLRGTMRMQHFWIRTSVIDCCCSAGTPPVLTQHATIGGRLPEWQALKCISSVSFVRIESKFFYNTQQTQTQKMMDPNFEIQML